MLTYDQNMPNAIMTFSAQQKHVSRKPDIYGTLKQTHRGWQGSILL
jgi:hypothetical protein